MSDEDIEKAVKEAAEFENQDKKRKEAIDTRNEADSMVFQTEKALEEAGDKVEMCIRDRFTDFVEYLCAYGVLFS